MISSRRAMTSVRFLADGAGVGEAGVLEQVGPAEGPAHRPMWRAASSPVKKNHRPSAAR